jgi:hypothetical protein
MKKIIFLLVFFIFLIVVPAGGVSATQYFVGVTIDSASAPGYSGGTNSNWCLPNGTTLAIRDANENNISSPITISKAGCAGNTIWSNLADLTTGQSYQIYVYPAGGNNYSYAFCSGYIDGEMCWVASEDDESCTDVCSDYNSTIVTVFMDSDVYGYQDSNLNCAIENFFTEDNCTTLCTESITENCCSLGATYNYFDLTDGVCYSSQEFYGGSGVSLGSDLVRVCPCNIQQNYSTVEFTFSFNL